MTDNKKTDYPSVAGMTITRVENNSTITYPHNDHLGSPVSATNASGSILRREQYTPYGEKLENPAANDNDQGFTSHVQDGEAAKPMNASPTCRHAITTRSSAPLHSAGF